MNNQAFIDGQNLILSTKLDQKPWKIDLLKFRKYLGEKYDISEAYYFIGCYLTDYEKFYSFLERAGYTLIFRAHSPESSSSKKGNVDTDVVFTMMKNFHEYRNIDKFYLISGDGDYFKMVQYLQSKGKLGLILFPSRNKSSFLYHQIGNPYYDYLDKPKVRQKIELKHKK